MVSERMDVPKVPDTLYELVYQLQVFKDQSALLHRYLLVTVQSSLNPRVSLLRKWDICSRILTQMLSPMNC